MPAFDSCHEQVVNALVKDGWSIVNENEYYRFEERSIYIDIRAEYQGSGQRETILFAEVKCFDDEKAYTHDFYLAIGQYQTYREILKRLKIQTPLFLAVPSEIYDKVFDIVARTLVKDLAIKMLIVDIKTENIKLWIR